VLCRGCAWKAVISRGAHAHVFAVHTINWQIHFYTILCATTYRSNSSAVAEIPRDALYHTENVRLSMHFVFVYIKVVQVGWPGLRVGSRLALSYIRHMNRVNSHNDLCHDDSTINIVIIIIFYIIIIKVTLQVQTSLRS